MLKLKTKQSNKYLDSKSELVCLSPSEQISQKKLVSVAKASQKSEQKAIKREWITKTAKKIHQKNPKKTIKTIKKELKKSLRDSVLPSSLGIRLETGEETTVAEIVKNKQNYHKKRCHDPMEPDYHNDKRIGYIITLAARPFIYSHAHGGHKYYLEIEKSAIYLETGALAINAEAIGRTLAESRQFYSLGDNFVCINSEGIKVLNTVDLKLEISRRIDIFTYDEANGGYRKKDCPVALANTVLALNKDNFFDRLDGHIRHPTLRLDGSLVFTEGYDSESRLYLTLDEECDIESIEYPSLNRITESLKMLLHPFSSFPFATSVDKATYLSGLLTAVIRKTLPCAPALAIEATVAGSGKTKLAQCIAILAGEQFPQIRTPCANEEEWKKSLLAAAISGVSTLIYDNFSKTIHGDALNAFLTTPTFAGRILGKSEERHAPTNANLIFTGNNLLLTGDINRRVLRTRLEVSEEHPELKKYDFDPVKYCQDHSSPLIRCALTLIRGHLIHGSPKSDETLGSYEDWDRLVRQTVLWLSTLNIVELGDPVDSIKNNFADDYESEKLNEFLFRFVQVFGVGNYKTVKEIYHCGKQNTQGFKHFNYQPMDPCEEGFTEILQVVGRGKSGQFDPVTLTWYLKHSEGRIINSRKLVKKIKTKGSSTPTQWAVVKVKS